MPTDNYYRKYDFERRRKQRRRNAVIKGVLAFCLVLAAAGAAFLVIRFAKDKELTDPYDAERGFDRVFTVSRESELLPAYAADICVVSGDTETGSFDAETGLLCSMSGGDAVFSKAALEKRNPASITKIMTCLLALKYGNLDDMVTVTEDAVITEEGASLAGIKPGDTLTLEQLLYGLMLPSGNDAANAVAVHIAGSIEAFAEMMNEEAQRLCAVDTHFVNPHGMTDEEHYTTAYDLYLILREAAKYDKFREITSTQAYVANYTGASGKALSRTWKNSNRYIAGTHEEPAGVKVRFGKTGTTIAAGNCIILMAEGCDGKEHACVVLKAQGRDALYENTDRILQKIGTAPEPVIPETEEITEEEKKAA